MKLVRLNKYMLLPKDIFVNPESIVSIEFNHETSWLRIYDVHSMSVFADELRPAHIGKQPSYVLTELIEELTS